MREMVEVQKIAYQKQYENRVRLLIKCPDQPGIVAEVATFLYRCGANIVESSQYTSNPNGGMFFLRMEFELPNLQREFRQLDSNFNSIAEKFSMDYSFSYVSQLKKVAIFVSKEIHCLLELLWEYQSGDLMMDIPLVISNHEEARGIVESFLLYTCQ